MSKRYLWDEREVVALYRDMAAGEWNDKVQWCYDNLCHDDCHEPSWHLRYPWIEFDDEQEYLMFKLRWG